ncbi:hypothetical protein [Streptomyces sp. NPDC059466]|uniref:hypothetical protein n=1 Tax=unclassified Streptomyces TaxID=2593676 RepID=UPI0036D11538
MAFPASLLSELAYHLAEPAEAGRTGLVFVGARGDVLRRNNFRRIWLRALSTTGLGDVHFQDLRHTGNTLAAAHLEYLAMTRKTVTGLADPFQTSSLGLPEHPDYSRILAV